MKVCHYAAFERLLEGGIETAIRQQRTALDRVGVDYTTDPNEPHDLLHLNVVDPLSVARLLQARRDGIPTVYHVHSTGEDFRDSFRFSNLVAPAFDRYVRAIYSRADRLIAVAPYTEQLLAEKGIDVPTVTVSNGVEMDRLEGFEELSVDEKYDLDGFTVANLAHVFERKGVSEFVQVGQQLPDVEFRWFGSRMSQLATSSTTNRWVREAPENVVFTGFVEDVRDAFAAADVFFFPSHEEHRPIALIEALYCGLPIVVRDIPQYEGWLEHGTHCLKGSTVEEFTAHIERLREDPDLRESLGEAAAGLAREQHTLEAVGERLREQYELTLESA